MWAKWYLLQRIKIRQIISSIWSIQIPLYTKRHWLWQRVPYTFLPISFVFCPVTLSSCSADPALSMRKQTNVWACISPRVPPYYANHQMGISFIVCFNWPFRTCDGDNYPPSQSVLCSKGCLCRRIHTSTELKIWYPFAADPNHTLRVMDEYSVRRMPKYIGPIENAGTTLKLQLKIPASHTSAVQMIDVVINKPFKGCIFKEDITEADNSDAAIRPLSYG